MADRDSRYWSKDLVTYFIEIYKANPCLWKIKSKDYTNKNLKNKAYDKLIEVCKMVNPEANKDYVVKKIQSFRGSFRKEMKKVFESKRSGAEDIYVPTLWYYNLLLFTKDQEVPTPSISNMDTEVEVGEENEDEVEDSELLEEENETVTKITDTHTASPSKSAEIKSRNLIEKQKGKRQRISDFVEYCTNKLETNDSIDEYDAVAISWAKKIKRMDPTQAIFAESLINKVLTEGLLKRLKYTTTVSND